MISPKVLSEQVKETLLNRILAGEYQPGDRLVESQIARELGLSQSPVREAIRDLVSMRFLETEPYKGARVRRIDPNELAEIYPVRASLEELAGTLAARRLNGQIGELEFVYGAMVEAAERKHVQDLVAHDADFHRLIVEAAGNRILMDTWGSLMIEQRTLVTAVAVMIADHGLMRVAQMHRPILDALKDRDPVRAAQEMRVHVETFGHLIREGRSHGTAVDRSLHDREGRHDDLPAGHAPADQDDRELAGVRDEHRRR